MGRSLKRQDRRPGKRYVGIDLETPLFDAVHTVARRGFRNVSDQIRMVLTEWLKTQESDIQAIAAAPPVVEGPNAPPLAPVQPRKPKQGRGSKRRRKSTSESASRDTTGGATEAHGEPDGAHSAIWAARTPGVTSDLAPLIIPPEAALKVTDDEDDAVAASET